MLPLHPSCRSEWLERWGDSEQRKAERAALDSAIAAETADREAKPLAAALQAAGVDAALVATGLDLLEDEHLATRKFFITQKHTYAGSKRYPRQPYRFRNWLNEAADSPSPTLGRDTRTVLARLTSLSRRQIDQFYDDDVSGTIPLAVRAD